MKSPPANGPVRKQWHSRNRLPHWEAGEVPQHITFRLADSLPPGFRKTLQAELASLPASDAARERRRTIEAALDKHGGACHLRDPHIGRCVDETLRHFDRVKYALHAWVVMPNHVHALVTPGPGITLSSILHSWKSFTAKVALEHLGGGRVFWAEEYYDRAIRDDRHFQATVHYIEQNPVAAGLCDAANAWPLNSASARDQRDQEDG